MLTHLKMRSAQIAPDQEHEALACTSLLVQVIMGVGGDCCPLQDASGEKKKGFSLAHLHNDIKVLGYLAQQGIRR
jgi:hypothetical protein